MSDLEMTCAGAAGEWWPIVLGFEGELVGCLREFACDNLGAFGYGSGDDNVPHCDQHEKNDSGNGCEACFELYSRFYLDRAELWSKSVAPVLATKLERDQYAEATLDGERIWFRVRETKDK